MHDSQYHIKPVMVARRRLTDQERHLAVVRIRTGSTQCDVAGELGVSQSVISRLVHRFRDTGSVGERLRSGAPRGTTRNNDQYLRSPEQGFDCSRAAITIERGQGYQSIQANHSEPTSSLWTTRWATVAGDTPNG